MAFILRCLTCGQAAEDGKKSCFQIDVKDKEGKWVRAEAKRWSSETGHVNRLSISFVGFDRKWWRTFSVNPRISFSYVMLR
eukprot:1256276-Amorphochlora_amoeboformis.AAC.1